MQYIYTHTHTARLQATGVQSSGCGLKEDWATAVYFFWGGDFVLKFPTQAMSNFPFIFSASSARLPGYIYNDTNLSLG